MALCDGLEGQDGSVDGVWEAHEGRNIYNFD